MLTCSLNRGKSYDTRTIIFNMTLHTGLANLTACKGSAYCSVCELCELNSKKEKEKKMKKHFLFPCT